MASSQFTFFNTLNEAEQVEHILTQIEFAEKRVKPFMEASRTIVDHYNNDPVTRQEKALANDSDLGEVNYTKANIIFGWIDQSLANMIADDPTFRARPSRKEAAAGAEPVSRLGNHWYRETNQLEHDEATALSAFLRPYGAQKIGYHVDFDERFQQENNPNLLPANDDPDAENALLEVGNLIAVRRGLDHRYHIARHRALEENTEDPAIRALVREHISLHRKMLNRPAPGNSSDVRFEAPFAENWPSELFLFDGLTRQGLSDAQFVAFGTDVPVERLRTDASLENNRDIEPNLRPEEAIKKLNENEEVPDGLDLVRHWEVWVKDMVLGPQTRGDRLFVVAKGHNKFLRKEDEWPYDRIDNFPAAYLTYQRGLNRPYAKPPLQMAGGDRIQAILNEILTSYLSVVRKQKNLWLYDPQFLKEKDIDAVMQSPDMTYYPVEGLAQASAKGQIIMPIPFGGVPPDKGALMNIVQNIFDRAAGTPQPVTSINPDSATESNIIEKRNTARENRRTRLFNRFQVEKMRKVWQLYTQFKPEGLEFIDPNIEQWIEVSAEVAQQEYTFTIDVASQAAAQAVEKSQNLELLNLMSGAADQLHQIYGQWPNIIELWRRIMERGFQIQDVEKILPMVDQPPIEQGQGIPGQPDPAMQEAIQNGANPNGGVGPLQPDSFNRNIPDDGRNTGAAISGR